MESEPKFSIDFKDTEIAFSSKSDKELKKMVWLFKLMNRQSLVNLSSSIGLYAIKLQIPFGKWLIKQTIFDQFVGGENLLDCQPAIDKLYKNNALTILDFGAEGKSSEEELNHTMQEFIKAVEFAAANSSVPIIVIKITGLVDNIILEKLQNKEELNNGEQRQYEQLQDRLSQICTRAHELGVGIFIDAEESWIQDSIDDLAENLMERYNKEKVIVYNTFQMYRTDKLQYLKDSYEAAKEKGYLLGVKLVRGAYMDKERERAKEKNYPSPINATKEITDNLYNEALMYCIDRYLDIGFCNATHNQHSNQIMAQKIIEMGILKNHPHLNFCQLYGMSDHITFNLAEEGFNVAKYLPYGPVEDVVPYLIRRAKENASMTGEMSRELTLVLEEKKRRGI